VAVETLLERSPRKLPAMKTLVPQLHYWIDLYIEIPILIGILLSGLMMLQEQHFEVLFVVKILAGLLAIGVNLWCVIPVVKRKKAADSNDSEQVRKYSRQILLATQIGFPAAMLALCIGLFL